MDWINALERVSVGDWAVVFATLAGPILAVQAQKAIERVREGRGRKSWVFHQLMATRAARLSPDHVQALNMIDLTFYGQQIFGFHHRSKKERLVLEAWREYHDHLGTRGDDEPVQSWGAKGEELFVNLLSSIASDVGFRFDRVQLKKGAYSPMAHGKLEDEQQKLRELAIEVLAGRCAVQMDVVGFPVDEDALRVQSELHKKLVSALTGKGALSVVTKDGETKR